MENQFYEELARWSEILGGLAFVVAAYALFRKFALPLVRANEIAKNAEMRNAEARRDALAAEVTAARAAVSEAQIEAGTIRERGTHDAAREHARIVEEARHEGTRLLQNARGELERGRLAGRDRLRIELIEHALLRARALAGERVDDATNARLVARTVEELTGRSA